ncbi:unnamed protein product [Clonostachys rhizophaga]|uniref:Uncharacterized protein n=1 Tax=Clonostachys rhizophaga TaxID=160324 RepID=A0A9N9YPL0_9HYPO|nr:unnamed protein product [Clonostachys rhizophaga]
MNVRTMNATAVEKALCVGWSSGIIADSELDATSQKTPQTRGVLAFRENGAVSSCTQASFWITGTRYRTHRAIQRPIGLVMNSLDAQVAWKDPSRSIDTRPLGSEAHPQDLVGGMEED